jgi:hypothetical protein
MSDDRTPPLKFRLLDEIWDEIGSLEGVELDEYLVGLGLAPEDLLQDYSKAMDAASAASRRARFEEARRQVRQPRNVEFGKILAFDVAKKEDILAAIKERAARKKDMTIAARNQRIEDEGDLNSFLEACLRLGVIDEEGNLID